MTKPLEDNVSHINVYTKGKSLLGRLLTNLAYTPFTHPLYGPVVCVEAIWFYLSTGRQYPEFLTYGGFEAKSRGKEFPRVELATFQDEIRLAMIAKLMATPDLQSLLKNSTLPFEHYYFYGTPENAKVINMPSHNWQLEYWEVLRKDLKAELSLEPRFNELLEILN